MFVQNSPGTHKKRTITEELPEYILLAFWFNRSTDKKKPEYGVIVNVVSIHWMYSLCLVIIFCGAKQRASSFL